MDLYKESLLGGACYCGFGKGPGLPLAMSVLSALSAMYAGHIERKHVGWAASAGTGRPLLLLQEGRCACTLEADVPRSACRPAGVWITGGSGQQRGIAECLDRPGRGSLVLFQILLPMGMAGSAKGRTACVTRFPL